MMRREPGRRALAPAALALLLAALAGCADHPVRPPEPPTIRGVVSVTFSGLGGSSPSADVRMVDANGPGPGRVLLVPSNTDGSGGRGIQLIPSFSGEFTDGERGAGGQRYAYATLVVRNAAEDGTPYDTPRRNLTFLAVSRADGIEGTAVVSMKRFGGGDARPAIARQIRPTGAAARDADGQVHSNGTDVLQAFSEADVAGISLPPGIQSALPYGFVASTASGSRVIPVGGEGLVTIAFRVPLQGTAAADPYTITFSFLVMEDSETRITQSLQEQDPQGEQAFASRAGSLSADLVTLLPGSGYFAVGRPTRTLCSVRTAGTAASPTAYMFMPVPFVTALSPDPYGPFGEVVPVDGVISATFDGPVGKPDDRNFVVNGNLGGRRFLGAQYAGGGNTTGAATPPGDYFPGEELEVRITTALGCNGLVARLRAASGAASGRFAGSSLASAGGTLDVAVGDLNGDRVLDIVEAHLFGAIAVRLGTGGGAFGAPAWWSTGGEEYAVALADMNADGQLDVVTGRELLAVGDVNADGRADAVRSNRWSGTVTVSLSGRGESAAYSLPAISDLTLYDVTGDGWLDIVATKDSASLLTVLPQLPDGRFGPPISTPTARHPVSLAIGDVTGDGLPDAVVGSATNREVVLMAGGGDGSFGAPQGVVPTAYPAAVVLADVDGNGQLDLVAVDRDQNRARVLLNSGGALLAPRSVALGGSPRAAVLVDLDGNGRLDLLSANAGSRHLSLLLDAP